MTRLGGRCRLPLRLPLAVPVGRARCSSAPSSSIAELCMAVDDLTVMSRFTSCLGCCYRVILSIANSDTSYHNDHRVVRVAHRFERDAG